MECETVRSHVHELLTGALSASERSAVDRHLAACDACRAEVEAIAETWQMLAAIDSPGPDSQRLRARFTAMLDGFHEGTRRKSTGAAIRAWSSAAWVPKLAYASAAAALILVGALVGRQWTPPATAVPAADIAQLRGEVERLREMVTLSLMHQQSASERLRGVSWSAHIDRPSQDVVAALLDALMHDPNVNVRLATVEALQRFAGEAMVRRRAVEALDGQPSPLVQIALIDFMVTANDRAAAPALRRLAANPALHESVRARATRGIQQLG